MIGSVNTGGGAKAFAFITATYPEGSVCTCTDGAKTLRAKNTTGTWVFDIPYAGTWTVSCTDGEHTTQKDVVIDSKGESSNIILSYVLYLIKEGVLQDGYAQTISGAGRWESGAGYIRLTQSSNAHFWGHIGVIDITGYSTLTIVVKAHHAEASATGYGYRFGIASSQISSASYIASQNMPTGNGAFTSSLDISNVTQTNGIYFVSDGEGYSGSSATTYTDITDLYFT